MAKRDELEKYYEEKYPKKYRQGFGDGVLAVWEATRGLGLPAELREWMIGPAADWRINGGPEPQPPSSGSGKSQLACKLALQIAAGTQGVGAGPAQPTYVG